MLMLALMVMTCIDASATCWKVTDLQGSSTLAARGWSWDEAGDSNATMTGGGLCACLIQAGQAGGNLKQMA
jgi:hypothetical protein